MHKIGVLSDTHGLLRPEVLAEQITRMYLTHPGVNVEGLLRRIRP